MNASKKALFKQLKGKNKTAFLGILMIILALLPGIMGASMISENLGLEPVQYTASTPEGTYCYIDVQLMTETYASMTHYGISTKEYCLASEGDYHWVAVGLSSLRYKDFADIVEYTYNDETNGPDVIRISGTLMDMEYDLEKFTDEYIEMLFEGDNTVTVRDGLYIQEGMNDQLTGGLISAGLGVLLLGLGTFIIKKGGENKKNAKKSISALEKEGKLEEALAEFASESSTRIRAGKKLYDAILGENYIFLFNAGKVMRYSDINCLSMQAVHSNNIATSRVLNVHDAFGTVYPVVTESLVGADKENSAVNICIAHIQQRNPNARVI